MIKKICIFLLSCLLFNSHFIFGANVGLLVVATGKYVNFVEPLIASAEKYFCHHHHVTYFIFTDGMINESDRVIRIPQERLGWPFDSMMRFHMYHASADLLATQDYLFACDADMLFVGEMGDEILGDRVATRHPGFISKRGSYETNPQSLAYVSDVEGEYYFAGGFYGGTAEEVLKIAKINSQHIDDDLIRGIIAVWHDESHWNRYCIDQKPTVILSPSYCYPEHWNLAYPKKLLALSKNHAQMRSNNNLKPSNDN